MKNTREVFLKNLNDNKVICYGAGAYFFYVQAFLELHKIRISALVDSDEKKQGKTVNDIVIQSPEVLEKYSFKGYSLIISTKNYADEVYKSINSQFPNGFMIYYWPLSFDEVDQNLEDLWFERLYKPCENLYRELSQTRFDGQAWLEKKLSELSNKEKIVLARTPLMITTRCTLRCEECSNLMPHYKNPCDYSAEKINNWISNISNAIDEWIVLELVGGEPFLHKELSHILKFAISQDKIQRIEFTTNGTVIPNNDLLSLLTNERVIVNISEYPDIVDTSKITEIFEREGIVYSLHKNMKWTKTGELIDRGRNETAKRSQYMNCAAARICRTILNGKMFACSKAASLFELGVDKRIEFVDIENPNHLRQRIRDFLNIQISVACGYCDIASGEETIIPPAIQLRK